MNYQHNDAGNLLDILTGQGPQSQESDIERFDSLLMLSDAEFVPLYILHKCEHNISDGECLIHQAYARRQKERSYGSF